MASDVLQDLMRALCSIRIVETSSAKRAMAGTAASNPRNAALSECRDESAQEAA
jgi:hypothetical protein